MRPTRILIADGQAVFRAAVRAVLDREKDFAVTVAPDLRGVLAQLGEGCADVALIDLALPPTGGIEAVTALSAHCDGRTEIVVWSHEPTRETVFAAVRAGAAGYLDKRISAEGLVRALRGLARGEAPLSRDLMSLVIGALHEFEQTRDARQRSAVLSSREREVLGHIAAGARNKQIASRLEISEFTVKRHVQNILRKLELSTRREAAAFYRTVLAGEPEAAGL